MGRWVSRLIQLISLIYDTVLGTFCRGFEVSIHDQNMEFYMKMLAPPSTPIL